MKYIQIMVLPKKGGTNNSFLLPYGNIVGIVLTVVASILYYFYHNNFYDMSM